MQFMLCELQKFARFGVSSLRDYGGPRPILKGLGHAKVPTTVLQDALELFFISKSGDPITKGE